MNYYASKLIYLYKFNDSRIMAEARFSRQLPNWRHRKKTYKGIKMTKKKDRRIRRSRKLLQEALIQLLSQKPLAKIQIKEIVDVADVSRPTFYQHFETKEKLLFSLIDDLFERVGAAVFDNVSQREIADMYALLLATYEQWLLHSEELQWVFQNEK